MVTAIVHTAYATGAGLESGRQQSYIQFDSATQRYSAYVDNKPVDWVIEQLEHVAGIEFTVYEDEYAAVNAQFEDLPLEKAIARLLYGTSHMISSGDIVRVFVLSREDGGNDVPDTSFDDSRQASLPGTMGTQHPPGSGTAAGAAAPAQSPPPDFRQLLIESLGYSPELDELRSQLELMPDMELSEEEIRLLQNPTDGQITDILLNNLLQAGTDRPGNESATTDQAPAAGE